MNQSQQTVIDQIAVQVEQALHGEGSGHDWWHVYRVWQLAKKIGASVKADMFTVELAALLHDIADWKFHDGDEQIGPATAQKMLREQGVDDPTITAVSEIIANMPYKGARVEQKPLSLEGQVVQDADRLDGLGAIGIARTFMYSGSKGRPLHDPDQKPVQHQSKEEYFASKATPINHFYEKLLLLKERLNLPLSKQLAADRHQYMEAFLERFYQEWKGER